MAADMDGLTSDTQTAWAKLVRAAQQNGYSIAPRSGRRTCAQQAEQYAIGRSGPNDTRSPTTYAQGCRSWHVLGRAVDFNVLAPNGGVSSNPSDYVAVGTLAEQLGWKWGGRFTQFGPGGDAGHVEWHPGLTIEQACPDPSQCVDVVPSSPEPAQAGVSFGMVVLGGVALAFAGGLGVFLARRGA